MAITRRRFTQAAGATIALALLGCSDGEGGDADRPRRGKLQLPDGPFTIGDPEQYRQPGVYRGYRQTHGVFLVSDGRQLVALSAVCPHNGCGTRYDTTSRIFKCPCHASKFSTEGLNHAGGKADRPLERCRLVPVQAEDGGLELRVDPTIRYRQDDDRKHSGRNWASPHSVFLFAPAGA